MGSSGRSATAGKRTQAETSQEKYFDFAGTLAITFNFSDASGDTNSIVYA